MLQSHKAMNIHFLPDDRKKGGERSSQREPNGQRAKAAVLEAVSGSIRYLECKRGGR